jgi:hypothetical protein
MMKYHLTLIRMTVSNNNNNKKKKPQKLSVGKDVKKLELLRMLMGT